MESLIREKFNDCFQKYIHHCESSNWVEDELYKFRFANWLNRKVNISALEYSVSKGANYGDYNDMHVLETR